MVGHDISNRREMNTPQTDVGLDYHILGALRAKMIRCIDRIGRSREQQTFLKSFPAELQRLAMVDDNTGESGSRGFVLQLAPRKRYLVVGRRS